MHFCQTTGFVTRFGTLPFYHMQKTVKILNKLKEEGIIEDYAIGGAIAAYFHIEPTVTDDLDVFISIGEKNGQIITLSPIYNRLKELGFDEFEKEGVVIDKWPVQFLPASSSLEKEALENSKQEIIEGEKVRVFTPEYLMAVCVAVGRAKDKIRLIQFMEENCYDETLFHDILKRHKLDEKWKSIKKVISDE